MITGAAHDLGRRIKAHGLGIEQRRGEGGGMMAFEPGRDIDQEREAGGMAFRKTIFTKAFDLVEAVLREFSVIAPVRHAIHEHAFKGIDGAGMAEGRHGPPKAIGLIGGEFGGHNGQPHRLFLKQRDAQRPVQYRVQLVGRPMFRRGTGKGKSGFRIGAQSRPALEIGAHPL